LNIVESKKAWYRRACPLNLQGHSIAIQVKHSTLLSGYNIREIDSTSLCCSSLDIDSNSLSAQWFLSIDETTLLAGG